MSPPEAGGSADQVERLLSRLAGVISAEAVRDSFGTIREIHVLATPEHQAKQVVRNVESALRAGLGIDIDRRIVSVAQLGPDVNGAGDAVALPKERPKAVAASRPQAARRPARTTRSAERFAHRARILLASFESRRLSGLHFSCCVRLTCDGRTLEGTGTGAGNALGRANAGARAVFAALATVPGWARAGLEGAALVDAHGHSYVIVAGSLAGGREPMTLAGAATLGSSPERAGILASLQATNRLAAHAGHLDE